MFLNELFCGISSFVSQKVLSFQLCVSNFFPKVSRFESSQLVLAVEVCLKPSSTARLDDIRLAVERYFQVPHCVLRAILCCLLGRTVTRVYSFTEY